MGSLPNLQALSDDPSVPYKYVLREPEDLPKRSYGPAVAAFNSQHYVDRCRVDQQARDQKLNQLFRYVCQLLFAFCIFLYSAVKQGLDCSVVGREVDTTACDRLEAQDRTILVWLAPAGRIIFLK